MKASYEIKKVSNGYVLIVTREDGSVNDYRFNKKSEISVLYLPLLRQTRNRQKVSLFCAALIVHGMIKLWTAVY